MSPRIEPIVPRLRWDVLSPADIDQIHEGTLRILEDTGVRVPSEAALGVLEAGGCRVDRGTGIVRFPRRVVTEALALAPSEYVLAGRDPEADLRIDLRHSYLSNDASGIFVLDPRSGEKRPSTKADVAESARFVDALPSVSFCWGPVVTSRDVPPATKSLHDAEAVFGNTGKHFQTVTTVGSRQASRLIEMAEAIAGGSDELRRRPILSFMQCTVGPLAHDGPNLEANMVAARHGLPSGFMPMPLACGTGPATLAGTLVVNQAEALSGVVLLQLVNPGVPCFISAAPSVLDLKSGGYTGGSPEDYLLAAACTQLSHFYGLPIAMGTMATGSKEPDWQAAVDDSLSTFASVMTSADMMNGCGLLDGSRILSYPHLVMETEIYGIVARVAAGIEVDEETLALDVIRRVGSNGTYLEQKHTRAHLRELWRPIVWQRSSYQQWVDAGRPGALEKATEIAAGILETHRPEPLPKDVAAEVAAIVARADRELVAA